MPARRALFAACLLAIALAAPPARAQQAQRVRILLRDGTELVGVHQGYDAAAKCLLLRTSPGQIEAVAWDRVRDMMVLSEEPSAPSPSAVAAEASAAERAASALPTTQSYALHHYSLGRTLAAGGDIDKAETEFRSAIKSDPFFAPARFALAGLYVDSRRPDDAIPVLRKVLEIDPRSVKAFELLERAYEAKGWIQKRHFTAVERIRTVYGAPEADYRIAHYWMEVGDGDAAKRAWDAYRKADPDLREACCREGGEMKLAEEALGRGDYPAALRRLHGVMQVNAFLRDEILARVMKARWTLMGELVQHKEFRVAFQELLATLEARPGQAHAEDFAFVEALYRHFTGAVLATGQIEELAEELRLAGRRLAPPDYEALVRAVLAALVEAGEPGKAKPEAAAPARPEALLNLCRLLADLVLSERDFSPTLRAQLHDFALAQFEGALKNDPAWTTPMDYAQIALTTSPRPSETERRVVQAIAREVRARLPEEREAAAERVATVKARLSNAVAAAAQVALAETLAQGAPASDDVLAALPFVKDAFLRPPRAPDAALVGLARLYALRGDRRNGEGNPEEAARAYLEAIALDPARRDALQPRVQQLVRARYEKLRADNRLTAARDVLEHLAALDPASPSLKEELGALTLQIADAALKEAKDDAAERRKVLQDLSARAERYALAPAHAARVRALLDREGLTGEAGAGLGAAEIRYLPMRPGAWFRYRRGDGLTEEITVLAREGRPDQLVYRLQKRTLSSAPSAEKRPYETLDEKVTLRQDEQGIYVEEEADRDDLLRFPIQPGLQWELRGAPLTLTRRYVSLNGRVATAKGTLANCLIVEQRHVWTYDGRPRPLVVVSRNYYAPNVGLVKVEYEGAEYADRNLILEDFKLP